MNDSLIDKLHVQIEFTISSVCSYQDLIDNNMTAEEMVRYLYEENGIGVFDSIKGVIVKVYQ